MAPKKTAPRKATTTKAAAQSGKPEGGPIGDVSVGPDGDQQGETSASLNAAIENIGADPPSIPSE
jgi:hypothetical protein